MKVKTSEASGPVLDWMVAKCEGVGFGDASIYAMTADEAYENEQDVWAPSTDWAQGGPIIEREKIDCIADPNGKDVWMGQLYATRLGGHKVIRAYGPTPLIAAMRCYVASKLGNEVEVPDELV